MDHEAEHLPAPAIPLHYFREAAQPWNLAVIWIVWLCLALFAYDWIAYIAHIGFYFWQELGPHYRYRGFDGWPLLIGLPQHFTRLIQLIGALDARKLQEVGRRWLVAGALLALLVSLPTEITLGTYYYFARQHWLYGPPLMIGSWVEYALSGVGGLILPLFIWRFFQRREVRDVFVMQLADG